MNIEAHSQWCMAHIKLAVVVVIVLILISLISRQCDTTTYTNGDGGVIDEILMECESLVTSGSIAHVAGGTWVLEKLLIDNKDNMPTTISQDQINRIANVKNACRRRSSTTTKSTSINNKPKKERKPKNKKKTKHNPSLEDSFVQQT